MLLLTKMDIKSIFTMKDAIEADKDAFRIYSEGKSVVPLRTNIAIPKYEGQILFMPGYVDEMDVIGVKIVSVFPQNMQKGKPTTPATMVLIDGSSGEVCAILDGTYLTQLRTGAASGAATDILARSDAQIGALIGTGGQGAAQLEAMVTARELKEVRVFDVDIIRAQKFVEEMRNEISNCNTIFKAVSTSDDAIKDADIITTVTTARKPTFNGNLVKAGAHVNAVGSYMPHMQELDPVILNRANKIYFESTEAVLSESGDIIIPLKQGLITKDKFTGELGQVIMGTLKGRESDEEITVFKTVGIATQDIVTARKIYNKAIEQNIGTKW